MSSGAPVDGGMLFDRFVVVDWSAAGSSKTGKDSIWIASLDADGAQGALDADREVRLTNPATRRRAEQELVAMSDRPVRTLVAVDASLGYPAGSAAWFGLGDDAPWRAMWRHLASTVVDDEANHNNRFEVAADLNRRGGDVGPFWGRPVGSPLDGLDGRKPARFPVPEYRCVEERLRTAGRRPASCWQLLGAGSVGGQSLTLIPILERLLASARVEVWPFTTGITAPSVSAGTIVVAETWPTAFDLDVPVGRIRDAAQVDFVVRRLRDADATGELAAWFAPELDPARRALVESEEGWVLLPPSGLGTDPAA